MSKQDHIDFYVTFPENRISDFFYLLRDLLYNNNCLSSANWVYQDISTKLHEFRYHICSILTDDKKLGPDFSEYRGAHATFKLIKMTDRFKVIITLEKESDYEGYLPKKTPWQEDFIRLKRKPLSIIPGVTLQNIIKAEELTAEEKEVIFDNISRSIKDATKIVSKEPTKEYVTTIFFKIYNNFFDNYYTIKEYHFFSAHKKLRNFKDNYMCVSKISKEYTDTSARRNNYFDLNIMGILLGLIANRHFTQLKNVPKITMDEIGITNFYPAVEISSDTRLLSFMCEFEEGQYYDLDSINFNNDYVRLPDDTEDIFNKFLNLSNRLKNGVQDSLLAFQTSLDLQESFPTLGIVALISAYERMKDVEGIKIDADATCRLCGHRYEPECPKCGGKYNLQGAAWREIDLLIKTHLPTLSTDENIELSKILEESYYRMRSAAVHSAKTRGLEYDSEEKTRYYLPDKDHFEPDWLTINYHFNSLKQLYYTFMIEWLRKQ